jgi:hypothetical protein
MSHHVSAYSTGQLQQTMSYKQQFNSLIIKLNISVNSTTYKRNVPLKNLLQT